MYDILTFNGVPFSDFNVYWDGAKIFGTPEKQVEFFEIQGRSGDLSISQNRFKNKNININCFVRKNFVENYTNLLNYLLSQEGYGRLENSKEPDIYRLAQFVNELEPQTGAFLKYGNFELIFNCKPQKYLKSGEYPISINSSQVVYNPTKMTSKPLIEVTGTGTITINDSVLTLANNTSITYIDCDIQDAYEGSINRNKDLTINGGFPVLRSGVNNVSVKNCTINLIPRWWRL